MRHWLRIDARCAITHALVPPRLPPRVAAPTSRRHPVTSHLPPSCCHHYRQTDARVIGILAQPPPRRHALYRVTLTPYSSSHLVASPSAPFKPRPGLLSLPLAHPSITPTLPTLSTSSPDSARAVTACFLRRLSPPHAALAYSMSSSPRHPRHDVFRDLRTSSPLPISRFPHRSSLHSLLPRLWTQTAVCVAPTLPVSLASIPLTRSTPVPPSSLPHLSPELPSSPAPPPRRPKAPQEAPTVGPT